MSDPSLPARLEDPVPTAWTRFLRTFLPWQLWRFAWINVKMIVMILKSHPTHVRER